MENYSIVFSSLTGNTKKLAEAIYEVLPKDKCDHFGETGSQVPGSDLLYIGFWTDKGNADKKTLELLSKLKGKKIFLEVYNDADDLPQGKMDVLFERFYRLDSSRNSGTGGSGIGLSVAKAIVQAHKGKITAENKNGRRLTITVIL